MHLSHSDLLHFSLKLYTIALCYIAETCTRLEELDACGCLRVSNKTVSAFQESLLYMKETGQRRDFRLLVGGMSLLLPFMHGFVANKHIFVMFNILVFYTSLCMCTCVCDNGCLEYHWSVIPAVCDTSCL